MSLNGFIARQVVNSLTKRGWLVARVERHPKARGTSVHFMHPIGWNGAQVFWGDDDLEGLSSKDQLDRIAQAVVGAERIARLCPWTPANDPGYPIALVSPPPHIVAAHERMPAEGAVVH